MSTRTDLRNELAQLLRDNLGGDISVTSSTPTEPRASSVFVTAADPYTQHQENGATFTKPAVFLRIGLIAPTHDLPARHDWLDDHLDAITDLLRETKKVGRFTCPSVTSSRIVMIAENQALIGMYIDLKPVNVPTTEEA